MNARGKPDSARLYRLPQEKAERIERILKGGDESDVESDEKITIVALLLLVKIVKNSQTV